MTGQALRLKAQVEGWRANNIWGLLLWQFNEVWPTGGWGSIEYGTPVKGQVLGGRWKPLQYMLQAATFADVTATCGKDAICYARNDLPTNQSVQIKVELVKFASGLSTTVATVNLDLVAGAGTTVFFCADGKAPAAAPAAEAVVVGDQGGGGGRSSSALLTSCTSFSSILNASNCDPTGRDCILNMTVQTATFPPTPPPPFPVPTPPAPPPPPPPPCPEIKTENNCTQAHCKWVGGKCTNPPPPPPPPPPAPPAHDCKFVDGTDYHAGLVVVKHDTPDQYACCGACDNYKGCVTTVYVFGACYLFDKRAINQSYSRPGHGVSCQTQNYTNGVAVGAGTVVLGNVLARNVLPLTAPGRFVLPVSTVSVDSVSDAGQITLSATATAVYVWLSTLAQGRFSENGVVLLPGKTTIQFIPAGGGVDNGGLDVALLKSSLRVEHLQQHLST